MSATTTSEPRRVFLVRHGQSEANVDRRLLWEPERFAQNIELTQRGIQQAERCGNRLAKLTRGDRYAVFHSPYRRALQTWEYIGRQMPRRATRVVVDGRLREQEYKAVRNEEEYEQKKQRARKWGKLYYRYSNGESGFDVLSRVGGFYNHLRLDMLMASVPDVVVIICHEVVMRCFVVLALELEPLAYDGLEYKNCKIVQFNVDEKLRFHAAG